MTEIVFPKNPNKDTPIFEAENGVQYKWEEDGTTWGVWRALGGSKAEPEPDPEPEPEPDPIIIETPSVITPPDQAGMGDDKTYNPTTSPITTVVQTDSGKYTGGRVENYKDMIITGSWDAVLTHDVNTGGTNTLLLSASGTYGSQYVYYFPTSPPPVGTLKIWLKASHGTSHSVHFAFGPFQGQYTIYLTNTKTMYEVSLGSRDLDYIMFHSGDPSPSNRFECYGIEIEGQTLGDPNTKLTLTDDKAYDAPSGEKLSTIDEYFKAGDKVEADTDPTVTGTLLYDADPASKLLTLTDVTGKWADGMHVVSQNELTEHAPNAGEIIFTSSQPATTSGIVNTWGNATWTVNRELPDGSNETQTRVVPLKNDGDLEIGPTDFNLEPDTVYWTNVKYDSADPVGGPSLVSESHYFKTDQEEGWEIGERIQPNQWRSVAYGEPNGQPTFVAVASSGTYNVMYSFDGILWNPTTATEYTYWKSVAYGDGKFVAVAFNGTNRSMHSTDGHTWSPVSTPDAGWTSVTYGDGKFVAVASTGSNRTMYSTDGGESWNPGTGGDPGIGSVGNIWTSVTYGDNKFVAVSDSGPYNKLMESANGIEWKPIVTSGPGNSQWHGLTYGNDKYVSVAYTGSHVVMYSLDKDGSDWRVTDSGIEDEYWMSVTYGNGKFVAVAHDGLNRIMSSVDGIDWSPTFAPEVENWEGVAYGEPNGKPTFVAVSVSGNAMYSHTGGGPPATTLFYDEKNDELITDIQLIRQYGVNPEGDNTQLGIYHLTEQPSYPVRKYERVGNKYKPIRDYEAELQALTTKIQTLEGS